MEQITLAPLSERALFATFWEEKKIFGFGDFQLRATLQRMADAGVILYDTEMVRLTDLGREVLRGEQPYLPMLPCPMHGWAASRWRRRPGAGATAKAVW